MDPRKVAVVIGITGNQGGSVPRTFLFDPVLTEKYRVRGVSRDPTSAASQELATQGIEIVKANLHDPSSLHAAFEGANVIFSVTDFWAPYLDPSNQAKAKEQHKTIGQLAYELEYEKDRNIVDAAARVLTLERFIVSMLSSPKKASAGYYQHLWHYESKADMMTYVKTNYPDLTRKTSELNMGVFFQSWRVFNLIAPRKAADGGFVLMLPAKGETPSPLVNPRNDTGPFVRTLLQLEPGTQLYGETSLISWRAWMELWGRVLGKQVRYEVVSIEYYEKELSAQGFPEGFGTEIAEMFEYMERFGYDGGDPACMRKEQLGIDIPDLSSVEDYIRDEDWSAAGV